MKLSNYLKYSFYPKKQALNFILSITIINILFFFIIIFKSSLQNEIKLVSNKYDDNTVYINVSENDDFIKISDDYIGSFKTKGINASANYLINTTAFLPHGQYAYMTEPVYYTNSYDFLYVYGKNYKTLYESEKNAEYSIVLTKDSSLRIFKTENSIGNTIKFNNNIYTVDKIIEPDNIVYGIYGRYYSNYSDDVFFIDNKFDVSTVNFEHITIGFKIENLDNDKLSKINGIVDTYSNLESYNLFTSTYDYIFNIINIISIFTLIFFIFNSFILLVSKLNISYNDIKIRSIFFESKSNMIKGYSISFICLFLISIIISLILSLILYLILKNSFSSFHWFNINVILYILCELATSFILSIIITNKVKY